MTFCYGQPIASPAPAPAETPTEDQRVLLTVDGTDLKAWQAKTLTDIRLGKDMYNSAQQWLQIHLLAKEAKERNIELLPEDEFYLNFYREQFLSILLLRQINKEIPEITDEQAKLWYDDFLQYRQPYLADVQHIRILDKKQAEEVAALARKPGVDFSELVVQYSQTSEGDKKAKGFVSNKDITQVSNFLERYLGTRASKAIENAKPGDIIGPIPSMVDFEIIKVLDVQKQAPPPSFESMQEQIKNTLRQQEIERQKQDLLQSLMSKANITETKLLQELARESMSQAGQPASIEEPSPSVEPQPGFMPQETPAPQDSKK